MDRFIELKIREVCGDYAYLKSNMDRFIVTSPLSHFGDEPAFKIQYG